MPYEPASIRALWNTFKQAVPQAQLGGIGGTDWKPGYHASANGNKRKWPGNYSIVRADDLRGDMDAARAIDITLANPADMKKFTQRLITAMQKKDPRMRPVREFFGTVNGKTVTGLDSMGYWVTSDNSHLWHIHISFYTRYATDHALMQGVAGVLLGIPAGQQPGKDLIHVDMTKKQLDELIRQIADNRVIFGMRTLIDGKEHGSFGPGNKTWARAINNLRDRVNEITKQSGGKVGKLVPLSTADLPDKED